MMSESLDATVEGLLEQVLDLNPADQQAILARHLATAPEACAQVQALLAQGCPPFLNSLPAVLPWEEWFAPVPPLAPGTRLADYDIEEVIGHGGMAVVYRARQRSLNRVVALKMILHGPHAPPGEAARFRTEAEAVARLQHPHIVQIHAIGEHEGLPFLALEYVDGVTLSQKLAGEPLPPAPAARLVATLARAVHHAHERGIVHLDLKPANILVPADADTQDAKITDFGLARRWENQDLASAPSGTIRGTPSYMAPEQANGQRTIGRCSDVYALGAILYELLTGRPPFRAATPLETLEQVRGQDPVPPRQLQPKVTRDLETVCLKCLEKQPARRYESAQALVDDLERWFAGQPVRARRVGFLGQAWRWCGRKPMVAALAAAVVLAVLAGSTASLVWWRRAASNEAQALANLHNEEIAHQEAEEHFAVLRRLMTTRFPGECQPFRPIYDPSPLPEATLMEAEECLSQLLQRRQADQELGALLAEVLTRRAQLRRGAQPLDLLERAAHLWEAIPSEATREPRQIAARASTYTALSGVYWSRGHRGAALEATETSIRLWTQLARQHRAAAYRESLFESAQLLGFMLIEMDCSEKEVSRRLAALHLDADLLGGEQARDLLRDLCQIYRRLASAVRHSRANEPAAALAAARQAAVIVDGYIKQPALDRDTRRRLVSPAALISALLRKGGARQEAFDLVQRVHDSLQEVVSEARENHYFFVELSISWHQVGKAHWELNHAAETLDAFREAIAAQRQACLLAPSLTEYRQTLGTRYLQLGRKLCELGRLTEAETYFRKRQALWPGDAAWQAAALGELRKWASQLEKDPAPARQQESQRYLALAARLAEPEAAGE